ncbi:MAG: glyoxalase superfamily protein [Bacteroidetes bacterium]|nr:glyoxalase superfamily protein [Bacteroidota bacterium]MDA1122094.1 glyoxalase superfamily protein [Bacteroidota bacterium]
MRLFETVIPILNVKDIDVSMKYYIEVLGFKKDWSSIELAQVSRDGFGIMFRQKPEGSSQEIWIGLHELDLFYKELLQSEAIILQKPENNPWAYDMKIKDIDENILWFGTEPM